MFGKILVGTSATADCDETLNVAAELATSNDAELVVLRMEPLVDAREIFDPASVPAGAGGPSELQLRYPGLRVRTSTVQGYPLRIVRDAAASEQPDLIVVGHGRSRHGAAVLSRRASKALVERSSCAVLLVAS
jgi:nucleotide-binding universal stress UspA family protein